METKSTDTIISLDIVKTIMKLVCFQGHIKLELKSAFLAEVYEGW